jgi:anti-sigma regulatory factor (Ser/Thr protein kinase)
MCAHTSEEPRSVPSAPDQSSGTRRAPHLGSRTSTWNLPYRPEAAGDARQLTRRTLRGWGIDDQTSDTVQLAVSELVTNAVEHARPPLTLQLSCPSDTSDMHVEVEDGGPAPEPDAPAEGRQPDEHGRGLQIIDTLATDHGTRTTDEHAVHWADLPQGHARIHASTARADAKTAKVTTMRQTQPPAPPIQPKRQTRIRKTVARRPPPDLDLRTPSGRPMPY